MSGLGYGQSLQTLNKKDLLTGDEIQRLAKSKKLQQAEKKGRKTQNDMKNSVKSTRNTNEKKERERQRNQELNRLRTAETKSGAKHLLIGETKKEVLPAVVKTMGGRIVQKPERYNPADEEKRH